MWYVSVIIEFWKPFCSPQFLQVPLLTGPSAASIFQWWMHPDVLALVGIDAVQPSNVLVYDPGLVVNEVDV